MNGLSQALDAITRADPTDRIASDPILFAHRYTHDRDREIAGFISSGLAYGRVSLFFPVIRELMALADRHGGPSAFVRAFGPEHHSAIAPLVYRFNRGPDHIALFAGLRTVLEQHGSLGGLVCVEPGEPHIGPALSRMVRAIRAAVVASDPGPTRWEDASRGLKYLLVDPADGSTAKRMAMFARWMVRPGPVDLHVWRHIDPSFLVMPVDTHVQRIARLVGLTDRRTPNWKTALDITRALAAFDPEDPVRFDFALAHLGISSGCKGAFDADVCPRCPLRQHCRNSTPP